MKKLLSGVMILVCGTTTVAGNGAAFPKENVTAVCSREAGCDDASCGYPAEAREESQNVWGIWIRDVAERRQDGAGGGNAGRAAN